MKKIEAVIRPAKVDAVCKSLHKVGHPGLMITDIAGHGAQKGMTKVLRGKTYNIEFITKTKIDIVVKDEDVKKIVQAIREAAFTGEVGDGKIFISSMDDVVRIRTAEVGDSAV
ncbi:MAG: P-II family nitrogen regulator [Candidatus Omnitrophota bacterium]